MSASSRKNENARIVVNIFNHQSGISIFKRGVAKVSKYVCQSELSHEKYYLSMIFVEDEEIQTLNRVYRLRDEPTDVLSFSYRDEKEGVTALSGISEPADKELGDIFISVDTAARHATEDGKPLWEELITLIIHGVLHLCGYDHETKTEAALMFSKQEAYVKHFLLEGNGIVKTNKTFEINNNQICVDPASPNEKERENEHE